MSKKVNLRKVILIDPQFQMHFIITNIVIALLVAVSIFGSSIYFSFKMKKMGIEAGLASDSIFFKLIDQQSLYLGQIVTIVLILVTILIVVYGLLMSHKIAGPVHNIKSNLRDRIQKNQHSPFKLRKGDFFQDLALLLNQYDDHLKASDEKQSMDQG